MGEKNRTKVRRQLCVSPSLAGKSQHTEETDKVAALLKRGELAEAASALVLSLLSEAFASRPGD